MVLLLLLISLTLPGAVNQGDRIFYFDARSLALGGVSTILENGDNPASLGFINEPLLSFSGLMVNAIEKRGLRVYDSYGNNIGIATVSNNISVHTTLGANVIVFPFKFLRLGIKYYPLWDFNYYYYYEYRDDFYQITKIVEDSYDGNIHTISPVLGLTYRFINFGIEQDFLLGKKNSESKVIIPNEADSIKQNEFYYSGKRMKLGLMIATALHLRLSYNFSNEYILESKTGEDLIYPYSHSVGFLYQPPALVPTKFVVQVEYETWQEPIFIYKFGVEHTILTKYALRYGFSIYPDYTESAIWTTVLTFGFGLQSGRYNVDVGFSYDKRDYFSSDFSNLKAAENLNFNESTKHLLLSIIITF